MRSIRTAAVGVLAAAITATTACGSDASPPAEPVAMDPCGAIVDCDPAGAGSVTGDDSVQGVAVVSGVDGGAELRVAFDDARGVQSAVVPRADYIYSESVTKDVALYDLDGRPGEEIVVSRGSDGTHQWFAVFTFDGRRLVTLPGPAGVQDPKTGMWHLSVGERQGQIVCGPGGRLSVRATSTGDDYFACRDRLDRRARLHRATT